MRDRDPRSFIVAKAGSDSDCQVELALAAALHDELPAWERASRALLEEQLLDVFHRSKIGQARCTRSGNERRRFCAASSLASKVDEKARRINVQVPSSQGHVACILQ